MNLPIDFNRNRENEEYHKGDSPLESLPDLDMIHQFPIDFMHTVCLGVVKRLLLFIKSNGPPSCRLPLKYFAILSERWSSLEPNFCTDFSRKPRSFSLIERFKATEFRAILLFGFPVILKGIVSPSVYKLCMVLHAAFFMMIHVELGDRYERAGTAQKLLDYFVDNAHIVFGKHFMAYNVHALSHIPDEYKRFGQLDSYSCFKYENYLKQLRQLVRSGGADPLAQVKAVLFFKSNA